MPRNMIIMTHNSNNDDDFNSFLQFFRSRRRKQSSFLPASSSSSPSVNRVNNVILVVLIVLSCWVSNAYSVYSNQFAVHVPDGESRANAIAQRHGFVNTGQIGSLRNYYLFEHPRVRKRSVAASDEHGSLLEDEPDVNWFEQQVEKKRTKRDFHYYEGNSQASQNPYFTGPSQAFIPPYSSSGFVDPLWKEQWYLTGGSKDGFDMNVLTAWKRGFTGKGIVVSILDDGIQTNHPDLLLNYDARASTDINDNDSDPTPQDNGDNKHGTRCAGEVAATAGNNICGVGVAYNASIGGVRMLDGTVNDAVEAKALGLNPDHIDIYSASWGPEDDGKTVDGPGPLARRAFIYGVTNGRRGLGSIFIWASGNGGRHVDSCNCDGYTNSIFTLSISSATQGGYKPWYLEECASTLATTYSSGTPTLDKSVATVDMDGRLRPDHICTVEHTGTSASAPLAAGIAALALEANPNLTWRDMQHLVVMTSRPSPLEKEEGWYVNGVQRKFSHKFGYGLMDAGKMVDLASDWAGVPPQHICKSREIREDREIPGAHLGKVKVFMDVDGCAGTNSEIRYLEHVQCKISLRFFPRGNLRILLTSPMGTTSVLLFERPRDVSSSNFDDWPFLSVHFWGEQAHGRWTLEIINSGSRRINQPGILKKWQLILYGTDINPARLKSRSLNNFQPGSQAASSNQYRETQSQGPARFLPQDFLYPGASEVSQLVQKPHMTRSQCHSDYWVADLAICANDCPDGYFPDKEKKECFGCTSRCKSCHNTTICTACEHNLVLFDTSCLASCPQGFYEADSSCEKCPTKSCAVCAGPMGNQCVQCAKGTYLDGGKCVRSCPPEKRKTSYGTCVPCALGCKSCNENKCNVCHPGYSLSSDNLSCNKLGAGCPNGLFLDAESGQCLSCQVGNCLACEGVGQCVQCQQGFLAYLGNCVDRCGKGSYAAKNGRECFDCPSLCSTCSSAEVCGGCRADAMLQDGRCLPHCVPGYYNDLGLCSRCSPSCQSCIGPGDTDCLTCSEGHTLRKGGRCIMLNGTAPTMVTTVNSELEAHCEDGYWYNRMDTTCQPCHPSCSKCNGGMPYNCRTCVSPLRLDRGSSRCISCCHSAADLDCCHCDAKKRNTNTQPRNPLTTDVDGECHFVSRRVSESEEREISSGKWSDSSVLSVFWLSVFFIIASVLIVMRRRRKAAEGLPMMTIENEEDHEDCHFFTSHQRNSSYPAKSILRNGGSKKPASSAKYFPVQTHDEDDESGGEEISLMREEEVESPRRQNLRDVPLVLNT